MRDEMTEQLPALWALDKAAKVSGWASWADAAKHASLYVKTATIAHARTLEKYEQPPEDPDKLAVQEILAAVYRSAGTHLLADSILAGNYDGSNTFQSALAAYKREKAK